MERLGRLMIAHPAATGAVVAVVAAFTAWDAYRIGLRLGELRGTLGEQARAASEALGG